MRILYVTTFLFSSCRLDMSPIGGFSSVDRPASYLLQWTEKARIQLIEAVIEVEEQMIARASTARWSTTGKRKVNTRFEYKWSTVANLLPIEYRGKIWNDRKQMYYKYKCDRMFNSLLHAYRERVAGKSTQAARWGMSEPVLKLLKKREDLVTQWCTETAGNSLSSEISTTESQQKSRNLLTSSEGWFLSCSTEEADACPLPLVHELESAQESRNFTYYVERELGSQFKQDRLSDIDHHVDSPLGFGSSANLSDCPDPSSSAHDQNLDDGTPFVRARVETRGPFHIGKRDSSPLKRRQSSNRSQPSSFLRRYTTSKAWKKQRKQALLVDIYAKETERNNNYQEEAVERCYSGCCLRSASEDPAHQGNLALSTSASPSRSFSESSVSRNMVQNRVKVQARAQGTPRKRDPNLFARPAAEQIHFCHAFGV